MLARKWAKGIILCAAIGLLIAGGIYHKDLGIQDIPLRTLKRKYAKPESRYIDIDGTIVHYCDTGKGPTLVALHGICDSLQTWDGWVTTLGNRYRIVRMDLPGFGLTGPFAGGDYSKETYISFLHKFLKKLQINNCILVGNSLGGAIAWNYTLKNPKQVERLVLIDPAGYPIAIPGPLKILAIPGIRHLSTWITPKFIYRWSVEQVLGDHQKPTDAMVDRFYELNLRPGNRGALLKIANTMKILSNDPDFSAAIRNIQVPTLLLWGEMDRWIPVSQTQLWRRDIAGLTVIQYAGVGHVPQIEIPVRSAEDVDHWLSAGTSNEYCEINWLVWVGTLLAGFVIGMAFGWLYFNFRDSGTIGLPFIRFRRQSA